MKSMSKLCLLSLTVGSLIFTACGKKKSDDEGGAPAPKEDSLPSLSSWDDFEAFVANECIKSGAKDVDAKLAADTCKCAAKEERGILESKHPDFGVAQGNFDLNEEESKKIQDKCSPTLNQSTNPPQEQTQPAVVVDQPASPEVVSPTPTMPPAASGAEFVLDSGAMHLAIPDNSSTGISIPLTLSDAAKIGDIAFTLYVTHAFMGDVVVSLTHPDGTKVVIFDQGNSNLTSLNVTYGLGGQSLASLAGLKGKAIGGTWTLKVSDLGLGDTGFLESFKLRIVRQ